MKRALIGIAAIATLIGTPALAADMPLKAPPPPVSPPVYNWTGCYVGGNVGGAWSDTNVVIPAYPANFDINTSSVIGGGQVGCNYMWSNLVIGIEGDYDGTKLSGNHLSGGAGGERFAVDFDSLATVRGRLGMAWGNTLFYATGGAAWANLDSSQYIPVGAGGFHSGMYSGWTAGGGIEYGLTANWIIGAEYLHAGFGTKDFMFLGPTNVQEKSIDELRARLSFKF